MSTLITTTLQGINTIKRDASTTAMNINSNGVITTPTRPMFKVQRNSNVDLNSSNNNTKITGFNNDTGAGTINVNNFWDTTNDRATAPVTGMYHFEIHGFTQPGTTGAVGIGLYINGVANKGRDFRLFYDENGYTSVNFNSSVYLEANDYAEFWFIQNSGTGTLHTSSGTYYGGIAGYLVG